MYKWAVRRQIRRNIEALGRGDLALDAARVRRRRGTGVPRREHVGRRTPCSKPAIEGFLRRFVAAGLSGRSEDILVNGPPWRTRIAVVFVDRGVGCRRRRPRHTVPCCMRSRAGQITRQEDFEDTQKVEAFDRWLHEHGVAPA